LLLTLILILLELDVVEGGLYGRKKVGDVLFPNCMMGDNSPGGKTGEIACKDGDGSF
jgi:hypothetical protein